jgi:hypothetical protein
MKKVQDSDKKISDPQENKEGAVDDLARIPGQDKNRSGDHYADHLGQTVEEQITIQTAAIEEDQHGQEDKGIRKGGPGKNFVQDRPLSPKAQKDSRRDA